MLLSHLDDVRARPDGPRKEWYLRGATARPALVAAAAETGMTILAGTDSRPHGRVADEIRALAAAGLTPTRRSPPAPGPPAPTWASAP